MSDTGLSLVDNRDQVSAIVFSGVLGVLLLLVVTPAVWPLWTSGALAAVMASIVLFAIAVSGVFERRG